MILGIVTPCRTTFGTMTLVTMTLGAKTLSTMTHVTKVDAMRLGIMTAFGTTTL